MKNIFPKASNFTSNLEFDTSYFDHSYKKDIFYGFSTNYNFQTKFPEKQGDDQ